MQEFIGFAYQQGLWFYFSVYRRLSQPVFITDGNDLSEYDELASRYETIQNRLRHISLEVTNRKQKISQIGRFCRMIQETDEVITEFYPEQFIVLVDYMAVYYGKGDIRVTFRDGTTL